MHKGLRVLAILLVLSSCTYKQEEGFISKTSTNTGLTCQIDDGVTIKAIYGADNRLDWFESPGQTKDYWAKATVALIPYGSLFNDGEQSEILSSTYNETVGLCPGNRFGDQPSAAFCSGFLVSDDLVVTAGHCIRNFSDCQRTHFVFDFAKTYEDQVDYKVPVSSVYSCSELVAQTTASDDYAVIRLDRKVEDRIPLNVRRQGQVEIGSQVMLIGHPMGIPSKIADGGFVQSVGNKIVATVDAFAANSGSVILNSQTGLVEGLLVAGEADFRSQNGCRIEAVCGNNCSGEVITPISKVLQNIPNITYDNPACSE